MGLSKKNSICVTHDEGSTLIKEHIHAFPQWLSLNLILLLAIFLFLISSFQE